MEFVFKTVVSLFLLFAAVPKVCTNARDNALRLNQEAEKANKQAQDKWKYVPTFSPNIAWVEAKDHCDPKNMTHNSLSVLLPQQPCIRKICKILADYKSAIERVSKFPSCSMIVEQVKPVLNSMHKKCMVTGSNPQNDNTNMEKPGRDWAKDSVCKYYVERLFSFSIITARVFAVENLAQHLQDSNRKCN